MAKKRVRSNYVIGGPYGVPETNTTFCAVEVPAGSFVPAYGVSVLITTILDGGTPSMTIGDPTAADGWLTSANITETTVGAYNSVAGTYSVTGKYYPTAGVINCALATGLTAGVFYVVAEILDVTGAI